MREVIFWLHLFIQSRASPTCYVSDRLERASNFYEADVSPTCLVSDKLDIIIVSDKAVWYTKLLQLMVSVMNYCGHAGN